MKFIRRDWFRFGKFKRKKKQKWRRPTGRDNKMREKRKGYPAVVSIGYKKQNRRIQRVIFNLKDLDRIKKDEIVVLGKVGKKKREEILKKAKEKNISISNIKRKKQK